MAESEKGASLIEDEKTNVQNSDIKPNPQDDPPTGDAQLDVAGDKEKVDSEQLTASVTQQPDEGKKTDTAGENKPLVPVDEVKKSGTNGKKRPSITVDEGKKSNMDGQKRPSVTVDEGIKTDTNGENKPLVPADEGKMSGTNGQKKPSITVDEGKKTDTDGEKRMSVPVDEAKVSATGGEKRLTVIVEEGEKTGTDGEKRPSVTVDEGKKSGIEGEKRPAVTVDERKKSGTDGDKRPSTVTVDERKKSHTDSEKRQSILKSDKRQSQIEGEKRKSILHKDGERRKSTAEIRKWSFQSASRLTFGQKSLSRLKVRRTTYGFGSVSGIRPLEKYQIPIEFRRPPLIYLNTYQLEPRVRFNPAAVEKAVNETLDEMFTGHRYNPQNSPAVALQIAGIIMRKVKYMEFNRYRIMALVVIGQKRAQSYINTLTFLWDAERDDYIDLEREEHTCFIQVTVFAVYLD